MSAHHKSKTSLLLRGFLPNHSVVKASELTADDARQRMHPLLMVSLLDRWLAEDPNRLYRFHEALYGPSLSVSSKDKGQSVRRKLAAAFERGEFVVLRQDETKSSPPLPEATKSVFSQMFPALAQPNSSKTSTPQKEASSPPGPSLKQKPGAPQPGQSNSRATRFSVKSLTLSAVGAGGDKKKSKKKDFHFAPEQEQVLVTYVIVGALGAAKSGQLALVTSSAEVPLRTWDLKPEDFTPGTHSLTWDGGVSNDELFPDGYVTIGHSPYELRLSLQGETGSEVSTASAKAHVAIALIELELGACRSIPP